MSLPNVSAKQHDWQMYRLEDGAPVRGRPVTAEEYKVLEDQVMNYLFPNLNSTPSGLGGQAVQRKEEARPVATRTVVRQSAPAAKPAAPETYTKGAFALKGADGVTKIEGDGRWYVMVVKVNGTEFRIDKPFDMDASGAEKVVWDTPAGKIKIHQLIDNIGHLAYALCNNRQFRVNLCDVTLSDHSYTFKGQNTEKFVNHGIKMWDKVEKACGKKFFSKVSVTVTFSPASFKATVS